MGEQRRPEWIEKRKEKGHDFTPLVEAINALVVTYRDGDDPAIVVDTVNLVGEDSMGPRYWWLHPVEPDGMWRHYPSGTDPAPLVELLCVIAECSTRDLPSEASHG